MKIIIALILTFFLSACTTFSVSHSPSVSSQSHLNWETRKKQTNRLKNWQANGSFAIHATHTNIAANASFSWLQVNPHYYRIRLFGPFGSQSTLLMGTPYQVTLISQNKKVTAPSAELLLKHQLGYTLPISNLYYWLRGLPSPEARYTLALDGRNRLLQLRQDGWQVHYDHYIERYGIALPDRLTLLNPQWNLRIFISRWKWPSLHD